jgi:predicted unusual protein kinase regulating ubiquinone biosynthesis (AarF/ABC1/UbiB family)
MTGRISSARSRGAYGAIAARDRARTNTPAAGEAAVPDRALRHDPAAQVPDYAGAFPAIGPAAIKLGQTLATRPDLVGEEAARNLLTLQDSLPPQGFALIRRDRRQLRCPLPTLCSNMSIQNRSVLPRSRRSIARRTTDGREVAVKVLAPRHPRTLRARHRNL